MGFSHILFEKLVNSCVRRFQTDRLFCVRVPVLSDVVHSMSLSSLHSVWDRQYSCHLGTRKQLRLIRVKWVAQSQAASDWAGMKPRTVWFKSFHRTKLLPYRTFHSTFSGIIIFRAIHSLEGLNNNLFGLSWIYNCSAPERICRNLDYLVYICANNFPTWYRFSFWLW